MRRLLFAALLASVALPAHAQQARVVTACGSLAPFGPAAPGGLAYPTIDVNGNLCLSGGGGPGPGGANTVVTRFLPLAQVSTASPICQIQGCTPTGSGYGATLTGTLTLTGNGGKFNCTTFPVLNVTTNAGGNVTTVNSVVTPGSCTAMGGTPDEVWTPGGGLSAGSGALFLLTWVAIQQTWTPATPAKLQLVRVYLLGGGAQGGGGADTNSGTASAGASGGGAAGSNWCELLPAAVGSSQSVTVGLGGRNAGQPATAGGTNGSNGQLGGFSMFGTPPQNSSLCAGAYGANGVGGNASATATIGGGGGGAFWIPSASTGGAGGGASGVSGAAGGAASVYGQGGAGGGGATTGVATAGGYGSQGGGGSGGGLTSAGATNAGGTGGNSYAGTHTVFALAGGAAGISGGNSNCNTVGAVGPGVDGCSGASGGGSNIAGLIAGNGGNGLNGAGGAGGGSVVAGASSGAGFGGIGGDGEVYVIESY